MGRLIKILLVLVVFCIIGLIVHAYFGDLSSPNVEIIQTVTPDA